MKTWIIEFDFKDSEQVRHYEIKTTVEGIDNVISELKKENEGYMAVKFYVKN